MLQTASVNTTRSGRILHSQPQTQPVKKIFLPRSRLWNFCPLHKSIRLAKARLAQASVPNSIPPGGSYGGKYIGSPTTSLRMILTLHSLSPYSTPVCRGLCRPLPNQESLDRHWKKKRNIFTLKLGSFLFTLPNLLLTTAVRAYGGTTRTTQGIV